MTLFPPLSGTVQYMLPFFLPFPSLGSPVQLNLQATRKSAHKFLTASQ